MYSDQETEEINKAKGVIYGIAIGDALGYPTEFMPLSRIKTVYGGSGIDDFPRNPAQFPYLSGEIGFTVKEKQKVYGKRRNGI